MDRSLALKHVNLCVAAADSLIRYRMRFVVITLCMAVGLVPLVTALGILEGLRFEAGVSVQEGADIFVSGDQLGANGPVPSALVRHVLENQHQSRATTRVVGRTYFGNQLVAVLGLDKQALDALNSIVRGSVPHAPGEVMVGQALADTLKMQLGMPFSLPAHRDKVLKLVGILAPSSLWSADVLVMGQQDANDFFTMKSGATQLLLYGVPDSSALFQGAVAAAEDSGRQLSQRPNIQNRERSAVQLERAYEGRKGIFTVLFFTVAVLAVAAFLITSGLGMAQMRKDIGVLKAQGWGTWDLLEKVALENLLVSLTAVSLAVIVSTAWMKGLNGALIGQFYVAEVGLVPRVPIPFRILPLHAGLCLLAALAATEPGGLVSTAIRAGRPPIQSAGYQ